MHADLKFKFYSKTAESRLFIHLLKFCVLKNLRTYKLVFWHFKKNF